MEYIEGENISNLLVGSRLHPLAIAGICSQLVKALEYLHHNTIIHCDVKPDNVIVRRDGHVYLCDLGLSQVEGQNLGDQRGTPYYIAPEGWASTTFTWKADVWSLGMTLVEMWTAKIPYLGMDVDQVKLCVMHNIARPVIEEIMPNDMMTFLNKCLKWDASQRATSSELMHHEFLKPINQCASECVRKNLPFPARAPSATAAGPFPTTVATDLQAATLAIPKHAISRAHDMVPRPAIVTEAPHEVITARLSNGIGVPRQVIVTRPSNTLAAGDTMTVRPSNTAATPCNVKIVRNSNVVGVPYPVMTPTIRTPCNVAKARLFNAVTTPLNVRPHNAVAAPRQVLTVRPSNGVGAPRQVMTVRPPNSVASRQALTQCLTVRSSNGVGVPHHVKTVRTSTAIGVAHPTMTVKPPKAVLHHFTTVRPRQVLTVRPFNAVPYQVMTMRPTHTAAAPHNTMTFRPSNDAE